jgi:hypothetical protein
MAHRVSGRERCRDDRGAEHQADDDQSCSPTSPRHVADAELEQHPIPQGERPHGSKSDGDEDREDDNEFVHRDAEELVHGSS